MVSSSSPDTEYQHDIWWEVYQDQDIWLLFVTYYIIISFVL